ncbi:MAG: NRDE family protein [Microthrixaceae bacterium]
MCTVLLRFAPDAPWPVLIGAIRDEFADRPWDPPGLHWPSPWAKLVGGRDCQAGGTWLAVDPSPARPALAALLNGVRRPPLEAAARPTRGTLALDALVRGDGPDETALVDHDGFHLLHATPAVAQVWSWDGERLTHRVLTPGNHILVNLGIDTREDALVPHFTPLLNDAPSPALSTSAPPASAWGAWIELLQGDRLDPTDPRALLVRREIEGRTYASTSATLVALAPSAVRYDFNPTPTDPSAWYEVHTVATASTP